MLLSLLLCVLFPAHSQHNYVRIYSPVEAVSPSMGATFSNSIVTTTYYDSAGRAIQTLHHGMTPDGKDMATHITYDRLGRKEQEWQPLPFETANGEYIPLEQFHYSQYSGAYHTDYTYGNFPGCNTVTETGTTTPYRSVTVESGYCTEEIRRYTHTGETAITHAGNYPSGSLSYTLTIDEDGNEFTVYKDTDERTILERRSTPGTTYSLDTYYIYDIYGNLRSVLPPMASSATASPGTYALTSTPALEQYAYFYEYDNRDRLTGRKLPGAGWYYTIYDADSRPVMTSTPEQYRRNEWSYTKYDPFGRPILEGTLINALQPSALATTLDTICVQEEIDLTAAYGYTAAINLGENPKIHKAYYYDDYRFLELPEFSNLSTLHPTERTTATTLLTGTYTASLNNNTEYVITAHSYDTRGRITHTTTYDNISSTYSSTANTYDCSNHLLEESTLYNTPDNSLHVTYIHNYDHHGRNTRTTLAIAYDGTGNNIYTGDITLHTKSYDDFCRIASESTFDSIYSTNHYYHYDGKYNGIISPHFTQFLHYDYPSNAYGEQYYNGRISAIETYQNGENAGTRFHIKYDSFGRYAESKATGGNGTGEKGIRETFSYDRMGNIIFLNRIMPQGEVNMLAFTHNGNHTTGADEFSSQTLSPEYEHMHIRESYTNDTYAYDLNGNETRDLTRGMLYARYNTLNLPDSITFTGGNILTFKYLADGRRVGTKAQIRQTPIVSPLAFRPILLDPITIYSETRTGPLLFKNGRLSQIDIPGGYISLLNDTTLQPEVKPYFFVKDYLGNVRLTCDGNTGEVLQSLEYLPSGVTYNRVNHSMQPHRFCGKEEVELHGFDMYDSEARWQYALIPRFSTMDPLAEKYYHLSPYAYCAGDPVNLVDPDGRKIIINDGIKTYTWKSIDDRWGFYDNDDNIYSGGLEYINEYSKALIELLSTNTGKDIVTTLANDEKFDVTLFSILSLGNKYTPNGPNINWIYDENLTKFIPTTNGPQKNIITSLGHELAHAVFQKEGGDWKTTWEPTLGVFVSISEIYTTHIENKIRSERGLPLRTHYLSDKNGYGIGKCLIKDGKSLFYNINEETKFRRIYKGKDRYTYN